MHFFIFLIFKNVDVTKQGDVDKLMLDLDGTENKSKCIKMLFMMLHNRRVRYSVDVHWVYQ